MMICQKKKQMSNACEFPREELKKFEIGLFKCASKRTNLTYKIILKKKLLL